MSHVSDSCLCCPLWLYACLCSPSEQELNERKQLISEEEAREKKARFEKQKAMRLKREQEELDLFSSGITPKFNWKNQKHVRIDGLNYIYSEQMVGQLLARIKIKLGYLPERHFDAVYTDQQSALTRAVVRIDKAYREALTISDPTKSQNFQHQSYQSMQEEKGDLEEAN